MSFVGILNKYLPPDRKAVLVRGCAVEFYTRAATRWATLALSGTRSPCANSFPKRGFEEEGRDFSEQRLGIVTKMPGSTLWPTERPVEVLYEGYRVPIASLEDIVIDRLLAAKYWRSPTDSEQATLLAGAHHDRTDWKELLRPAIANDVQDVAKQLRAQTVGKPETSKSSAARAD